MYGDNATYTVTDVTISYTDHHMRIYGHWTLVIKVYHLLGVVHWFIRLPLANKVIGKYACCS